MGIEHRTVWEPDENGVLSAFVLDSKGNKTRAAWAPQSGSQEKFLACPLTEVLYEGTRGPGKTDALLMDFGQFVGRGFGAEWRGILFRKTYPELQDAIEKSKKWFMEIWPDAKYNESMNFWKWPTGEKLYFRQFQKPDDYYKYHGHAYPWIAWEELTTWADDKCFKSMFSCARSPIPGIEIRIRATTNPYGVGHNWVKNRYALPVLPGKIVGKVIAGARDDAGNKEPSRVAIHGHLDENRVLMSADPEYKDRIRAAARSPAELEAWLNGSWDIVAGGMFDDIWYTARHHAIVEPFEIPSSWRIDRSFDWGSSAPFAVGWWAESDGSDVKLKDGTYRSTVRGDLYRIKEWYGWNGTPNEGLKMLATEIAQGIVDRETRWGWHGRVKDGPADTSIFDKQNGNSIAEDMNKVVRVNGKEYAGVRWERADKSPGSRKQGWEQMRKMFRNSVPPEQGAREHPGLFIFTECEQFLRTVPTLPRCQKDMDDVDTTAEDHIADEARYRIRFEKRDVKTTTTIGMY